MLIELTCTIVLIFFIILLIKERDFRYIVGFLYGLIFSFLVEPLGVTNQKWLWQNIIPPFNYPIFGIPIAIHLIYAISGAITVLLVKIMLGFRGKYKEKHDRIISYNFIAVGVIILFVRYALKYDIHLYIGLIFIMVGLYLLVRNPIMFFVGIIALVGDFILEHLYMLTNQLSYSASYGDVGIGFFLGGANIAAIVLLMRNRFSKHNKRIKK